MRTAVLAIFLSAGLLFGQQSETDSLFSRAVQAQQNGDNQTAIRYYRQLLKLHPDIVGARANLGTVLAHEGEYDEAIVQDKLALASVPGSEDLEKNLGLAYYKKGDMAHAHAQFESVYKARPQDAQVAILLGYCDERLGHPAEAVAILNPLKEENAANPDFQYVLGSALVESGRRRDGVALLEKTAAATRSADAYLLAGSTLLDMNEFAPARKDLEAALTLNPNLPHIYSLVGLARDQDGDATGAEPALREALKRDPGDFKANLYLGAILYKRRDMTDAKTYLDRAIQIKPDDPTANYEIAMLESMSGQYDAAAKKLESLVKANPDWLQPHVELANVYYRLHRPTDGAKERAIVAKLTAQQQSQGPPPIQQP